MKLRSQFGTIEPEKILGTSRFDFEVAKQSKGWQLTLRGDGASEAEEYGVCSFGYRARRPFHPQRLYDRLSQDWNGILRSKELLLAREPTRQNRCLVASRSNSETRLRRILVGRGTRGALA